MQTTPLSHRSKHWWAQMIVGWLVAGPLLAWAWLIVLDGGGWWALAPGLIGAYVLGHQIIAAEKMDKLFRPLPPPAEKRFTQSGNRCRRWPDDLSVDL